VCCARYFILLIFCVVAISPVAAEQQSVAGITIDYPVLFERMKLAEDALQRNSTARWGAPAGAVEVHQASIPAAKRLTGASGMLEIARVKFATGRKPNLGAVATVASYTPPFMLQEPLKIMTEDVSVDRVSGLDGRRLSFEAEAGGWTMFGHALLIYDPDRNDFWDIKIVLLRRFLATYFVSSDRVYPKSILDTVRVVDDRAPMP
jgi:hypothetical protein